MKIMLGLIGFLVGVYLLFAWALKTETAKQSQQKAYPTVEMQYYQNSNKSARYGYKTVIIDSCEYVYVMSGHLTWGSHKGNCRFCAARRN